MSSQTPDLDHLTALAVDVKSVDYDWSEHSFETEYMVMEPTAPTPVLRDCKDCNGHGTHEGRGDINCPNCWGAGKRVDFKASHYFFNDHMGVDREEEIIFDSEDGGGDGSMIRDCWQEYGYDNESWGPMMNYYYYEVPDLTRHWNPNEAALVLDEHVPLTLIYLAQEDEYALALTGGGMDLTWEICWAYILLGYLPPTNFTNLPRMSHANNDQNRLIIAACRKSLQLQDEHSGRVKDHLDQIEQELREAK